MSSRCTAVKHVILTLATATILSFTCCAQEVVFVDLTRVAARLELRRPKANGPVAGGYHGSQYTNTCFDSKHDTGRLHTSLVSLDRTHYQVGDEPIFEVTVQNTGSSSVRIPISPNLADLQPKNPAQKFAYYELQIVLWIGADGRWSTNMGGSAVLYGADANTMTTLDVTTHKEQQL